MYWVTPWASSWPMTETEAVKRPKTCPSPSPKTICAPSQNAFVVAAPVVHAGQQRAPRPVEGLAPEGAPGTGRRCPRDRRTPRRRPTSPVAGPPSRRTTAPGSSGRPPASETVRWAPGSTGPRSAPARSSRSASIAASASRVRRAGSATAASSPASPCRAGSPGARRPSSAPMPARRESRYGGTTVQRTVGGRPHGGRLPAVTDRQSRDAPVRRGGAPVAGRGWSGAQQPAHVGRLAQVLARSPPRQRPAAWPG